MNSKKIKVIIADDDQIYREGLKSVIETAPDIEIIDEVSTAQIIYRKVIEKMPDVLIIDLSWYGDSTAGWSAIKDVKQSRPEVKILALTNFERLIDDARRVGADGALVKTFEKKRLFELIHSLVERKKNFAIPDKSMAKQFDLSDREIEVLILLATGKTNRLIADQLFIAESTVKNHIKSIFSKLNAQNRTDATRIARDSGIIS